MNSSADWHSEQKRLVAEFEANFNAVEKRLKEALRISGHRAFVRLVDDYAQESPGWKDKQALQTIADLRNLMIHNRLQRNVELLIPTQDTVDTLAKIRQRLELLAGDRFRRDVICIGPDTPLQAVLGLVAQNSFSQFPVYDGERYLGLLTENGITRWLARHASASQVELLAAARDVLETQEVPRERALTNYHFISPEMPVHEVAYRFSQNLFLEAALMTESGDGCGKLLGIATRWDIFELAKDKL